ncbi:MAG: peptidylprolyl isomerase [Sphingomonadaceae bacterium]|nr:peptidylprolyl isomerase [Sphingomonadaceae bacterium]
MGMLMKRIIGLLALCGCLAMPAAALAAPVRKAPTQAIVEPLGLVRVALTTSLGTIVLELDGKRAPITTANFLRYVDQRRLDGTVFYRTMRLDFGGPGPQGLIQGGTQYDPKRILKPIAHEPTNVTGILHKAGTISMARWAPGTATCDFSILLSDMPALDADPGASGDNAGYAAFGHVVEGMDVVQKIHAAPVSATKGEGVMRGQMIEAPVRILTARRAKMPLPAAPAPSARVTVVG